jgi:glutathione S-transferase
MNLHLHYWPGACSFVPHVMLERIKEACGQNYESSIINLANGEQLKPEYKAINPRGQVPVLIADHEVITQIVAIVNYLNEIFPQAKLLPNTPLEKAQALSMLAWMNNTVHPTFTRIFRSERFANESAKASVKEVALETFKGYLVEIDTLCSSNSTYLCGEQLTPADIYAVAFIRWAGNAGINTSAYPNYMKYAENISAISAVKNVMAKEGIALHTFKC